MLAGLIFAIEDADDRPGMLAATLPFGGLTLVESQARLLITSGVSQIVLVVARMTPELLGAIHRIGRRCGSIDAVRTASEAAEKLHPLARVLVVGDGVTTTAEIMAMLAGGGGDALLVTDDVGGRYERVGAKTSWAGLARIDVRRIAEVAAMPKDYDFQSTLLRMTAQAGAEQMRLPPGAAHGIEREAGMLAERGKAIVAALVPRPVTWAERLLLEPVARLALPPLIRRTIPSVAPAAAGTVLALAGCEAIFFGWPALGVAAALVALLGFFIAGSLSLLRDETMQRACYQAAAFAIPAAAALLLGRGSAAGLIAATSGIGAAGLVERAGGARIRRRWWASPAAYLATMFPFAVLQRPLGAVIAAGLYAAVTLGAAIEALREKP